MNIIVCIKQVPSSNKVIMDPETHTIVRDGKKSVVNPYDSFALEEALKLKDKHGGKVMGLSMGIMDTKRILKEAQAQGADECYLLSDRAFAGADTLATSYALSLGANYIHCYDLIICGKMAIDGDTAQIGPELAEWLHIPHVSDVSEIIDSTETDVTVRKTGDFGEEIIKLKLPSLITVNKDINLPRLASLDGFEKSLHKPVKVLTALDLNADLNLCGLKGSPTQVVRTYVPENQSQCKFIHQEEAAGLLKTYVGGIK